MSNNFNIFRIKPIQSLILKNSYKIAFNQIRINKQELNKISCKTHLKGKFYFKTIKTNDNKLKLGYTEYNRLASWNNAIDG